MKQSALMRSKTKRAVAELKENIAKAKRNLRLPNHPFVSEVWQMFPPTMRRTVSVGLSTFSANVSFCLFLYKLDSFKDKKLVSLLAKFADPKWTTSSNDWTAGNEPNRDYCFTYYHPEGFTVTVLINAYVKSDSPNCRIVTKVHEEVVKKEERFIVCD